jgi:hypothetical protein
MTIREKLLRDNALLPLYYLLKQKGGDAVAGEDASVCARPDCCRHRRGMGARSS